MASDSRTLILSQDYELFFLNSGSVEHCLVEPCNAMLATAGRIGLPITFFVDIGMVLCMQRYADKHRAVARMVDEVRTHIESLFRAGHEIALHVHPHWEDTVWRDERWDFTGSRYKLDDFSADEILEIFRLYAGCLADITGEMPASYRAGGFCIEPFGQLSDALTELGITIDSSVVPGLALNSGAKGFDFRHAPDREWWSFDDSPLRPIEGGRFLELPISARQLPFTYYWGRMIGKLRGTQQAAVFGDGNFMGVGVPEILRRLAGFGRMAEMSVDDPKIGNISVEHIRQSRRRLWQFMGHPKLSSMRALGILEEIVNEMKFDRFETISSAAALIRSGELGPGQD